MKEQDETVFLDKNGNCKYFVCDICGNEELVQYEGAEPNTCAMCMPLAEADDEDCVCFHSRSHNFDFDEQNCDIV